VRQAAATASSVAQVRERAHLLGAQVAGLQRRWASFPNPFGWSASREELWCLRLDPDRERRERGQAVIDRRRRQAPILGDSPLPRHSIATETCDGAFRAICLWYKETKRTRWRLMVRAVPFERTSRTAWARYRTIHAMRLSESGPCTSSRGTQEDEGREVNAAAVQQRARALSRQVLTSPIRRAPTNESQGDVPVARDARPTPLGSLRSDCSGKLHCVTCLVNRACARARWALGVIPNCPLLPRVRTRSVTRHLLAA